MRLSRCIRLVCDRSALVIEMCEISIHNTRDHFPLIRQWSVKKQRSPIMLRSSGSLSRLRVWFCRIAEHGNVGTVGTACAVSFAALFKNKKSKKRVKHCISVQQSRGGVLRVNFEWEKSGLLSHHHQLAHDDEKHHRLRHFGLERG